MTEGLCELLCVDNPYKCTNVVYSTSPPLCYKSTRRHQIFLYLIAVVVVLVMPRVFIVAVTKPSS